MQTYQDKIDSFIQIPNIGRGKIKYIGPVNDKKGYFVGVDLLANIGKNDGSFMGIRYFNTVYPQSGLFIQFPKVAHLVEQASKNAIDTVPRRNISETIQYTRSATPPTPVRSMRMSNNVNKMTPDLRYNNKESPIEKHSPPNNEEENDVSMEIDEFSSSVMIDQPVQSPQRTVTNVTNMTTNNDAKLQKCLETIKMQEQTIAKYEALLNEQRLVLEEIQPVMDACEQKSIILEKERNELQQNLTEQQTLQERQKLDFIKEQQELLTAVDKLNEEIKEHSNNAISANTEIDMKEVEELRNYKKEMETARIKWNKEKEQLRMHNESLSKEYTELNKELMKLSAEPQPTQINNNNNDEIERLNKQVDRLEQQLSETRKQLKRSQVVPTDTSNKEQDSSLLCVLCEKTGHDQLHCPSQYSSTQ
ncbi:hypothetical protein C6P45_004833 [Maudiozyma exigua]|uniref:CAP-Gly domain-containing protein n=1 Tax=Maudiozyma exigua TaxID=34358 RepID=A0A9P6WBE2_MAUEX|nr:hypothetical protein C6P45_004833 [Kazachstania exigua]